MNKISSEFTWDRVKNNVFQPKEAQACKLEKEPTTKQPLTNKPIDFEGSLMNIQQQPNKKQTHKNTKAESWYYSLC